MAKKSKLNQKLFYALSILFAIVAICMIFVDVSAITKNGESAYVLTGLQATFGYSESTKVLGSTVTTTYTTFSIMNLFIYICLLVGVVFAVLRMLKVAKSNIFDWVIAGLFIASTILYFFMPTFVSYEENLGKIISTAVENGASKSILIGGIIGGISSLMAAILIIAKKFVNSK